MSGAKNASPVDGKDLSRIERVSLGLGAVVSLCMVVSTIWYAAVAANDLTHSINDANKNINKMYSIMEKKEAEDKIMRKRLDNLQIKQDALLKSSPSLVHLDKKYAVMESPDGDVYMLTIYSDDDS